MAKIQLQQDEPLKVLHLVETLFPGVKLDAISAIFKDTKITGTFDISKKINTNESVQLQISIT